MANGMLEVGDEVWVMEVEERDLVVKGGVGVVERGEGVGPYAEGPVRLADTGVAVDCGGRREDEVHEGRRGRLEAHGNEVIEAVGAEDLVRREDDDVLALSFSGDEVRQQGPRRDDVRGLRHVGQEIGPRKGDLREELDVLHRRATLYFQGAPFFCPKERSSPWRASRTTSRSRR